MSSYGMFAGVSSPPAPIANKTMWFDALTGTLKIWTGTQWDGFTQYHIDFAMQSEGGTGQDTSGITGLPILRNGTWYFPATHTNIVSHGGSTGASAAVNTSAINEAIATGKPVHIPPGDWNFNAWDAITDSVRIFGAGRSTRLIFNTTGDAIYIHPAAPNQGETYHLSDLSFDNVTNVPASFIRNNQGINVRLDHLYFVGCEATYCIDNQNGYGVKVADCVFYGVTGNGVRLRDNLQLGGSDYSYVASIAECDLTAISGTGIVVAGAQGLKITSTVVESCGGKGIDIQAGVGGAVQAWNVLLDGVYFEANTGIDLDLQSSASGWCDATLIGCTFVQSPVIALGVKSRVLIMGNPCGGGSACTITGSGWAQATLISTQNFIQSGTFAWAEISSIDSYNTTKPMAYSPAWGSGGTQPAIGNGSLTGYYTRIGQQVTAHIRLVSGSTTTFGTGDWYFSVPFASGYSFQQGDLIILDSGGGWFYGHATTGATSTTIMVNIPRGATVAAGLNATFPMTWTVGDELSISITYWV
jgi:hypothetical protein